MYNLRMSTIIKKLHFFLWICNVTNLTLHNLDTTKSSNTHSGYLRILNVTLKIKEDTGGYGLLQEHGHTIEPERSENHQLSLPK